MAAILRLGVSLREQMGVNFKLSRERTAAPSWQWGWPAWCLIKRHVDLCEAPGGTEMRAHLTASKSELSHYGPNLSICSGAFSLICRSKPESHGFVEEEYQRGRYHEQKLLKSKHWILMLKTRVKRNRDMPESHPKAECLACSFTG